ncbi:hypothetical protein AJ80_01992 [Polytolypa hystricis UAMH7299]|uniref:Phospholipid/glycerol acyltransferase domain-containing protein n=1 Tax=Polytolypa hystricis (strain UAMH7299) TaxID=1447883 RepID=A0A2B7YRW7_POLH7|nr:hypothetical protein AJ80_01992 [Polytolypa hystricis UAMH7299]
MEKFSQFRDRGSGIAPFLPISPDRSGLLLPFHVFLFCLRLPFFISACFSYFFFLQWLPIGSLGRKASLWVLLGIPGIWWVDLQIDGVRKGSLAMHEKRLPQPKTVIASCFTSPIDALYLAAIFDPIFTVSYPYSRKVRQISLLEAMLRALSAPELRPPPNARLVDLATLLKRNPDRVIAVFPECTTTNGKGILRPSPSLVTTPPATKIFPVSIRYSPADITTPVPNTYISFLWRLFSKPTHCIRVRIAESVIMGSTGEPSPQPSSRAARGARRPSYSYNYIDALDASEGNQEENQTLEELNRSLTNEQKALLGQVGEALARLGRVRTVGLGAEEKREFVSLWSKRR